MYTFKTLSVVIMEEIVLRKHALITGQELVLSQEHEYFLEGLDGSIDDLIVESAKAEMLADFSDNCAVAQWLADQYQQVKTEWAVLRGSKNETEDIPF